MDHDAYRDRPSRHLWQPGTDERIPEFAREDARRYFRQSLTDVVNISVHFFEAYESLVGSLAGLVDLRRNLSDFCRKRRVEGANRVARSTLRESWLRGHEGPRRRREGLRQLAWLAALAALAALLPFSIATR